MNRIIRTVSIILILSFSVFYSAYALEYNYSDDNASISAEDKDIGVKIFATEKKDSSIKIAITLIKSKKSIISTINFSDQTLKIKSLSKNNQPVALKESDILLIKLLGSKFNPDDVTNNKKIADALDKLLAFLSETPPRTVINIDTGKIAPQENQALPNANISSLNISSLCSSTGQEVTGSYTIRHRTIEETVQLGPCYNASNACLGRCGPGCNPPPATRVQQFTQDCLNHDLCTQATGLILGPCRDEWIAAADDFFFAANCGNMTGQWVDDVNSLSWDLNEDNFTGLITGTAVNSCVLNVSGFHTGADSTLSTLGCSNFTYSGTASDCDTVKGDITSGGGGTYVLCREGSKDPACPLNQ